MPSKSSNALHKFRGFHLKYNKKKDKQSKVLPIVLNVSTPKELKETDTQTKKSSRNTLNKKFPKFRLIKRTHSKSDRGSQKRKLIKTDLQASLKHPAKSLVIKRNLNFTQLSEENLHISSKSCVSSHIKDSSCEPVHFNFKEATGDTISLTSNVTIQAIQYKCKLLQFHNTKCSCSTPRLHVYLNTNHRCYDKCSIESCYNIVSNPSSSPDYSPLNKYIFLNMTGKSTKRNNDRKNSKEERVKKIPKRRIDKFALNVQGRRKKSIPKRRPDNDEPESELLGEECESLPNIMSTLSGDVEYIVLDDTTFNLSTTTKNEVATGVAGTKDCDIIDEDSKADIPCISGMPEIAKQSGNWEFILEKCLSEIGDSGGEKYSLPSQDSTKIKVEQEESANNVETSGLAGICTNLCPSIKDIFGDICIKDEPIDTAVENDMSVEDFNREIKKLTSSDVKTAKTSKEIVSNERSKHQELETNKGLFEGLIKEEEKVTEYTKQNAIVSHESEAELRSTSNESKATDGYSSDDSIGPLQIDEGEQNTEEHEFSSVSASSTRQTTNLLLPSVNIISPFKIKILFGNPQRIELEKNRQMHKSSLTSVSGGEQITGMENGDDSERSNSNLKLIEEDSLSDSLPTLILQESNNTPNLMCIYCNTVSPDVQALAKHFEDHQKEGLIICYFCQKSFGDKTGMKRHMRSHTGEKPYQCKVCGKRFSLPGNFKKHRDIHEDKRTEPCEVCGKTFRRKEHLKYHMRTHTGEKPYTCSECGTSFTARYSLHIHMNIHLGKKPYKCTYCNKAFSDKSTMRKHIRVHTGEKPYHCEKCGKCFGESGTLAAHMATHRSDRPYKCRKCHLGFKTTGGLRQHEKIHNGEKQYACKYCGVKFLQKYNMTMHERIHTGERPYACEHCERTFRSRSCLTKHIVLHGGDEERRYECEHCNSRFYRKAHLRRHIDMHLGIKKHVCNICLKKFCTQSSLENHRKTFHAVGARQFPCTWCGRIFKRRVYVNTHECIRDPAKVEKYKQELKAAVAAAAAAENNENDSLEPSVNDNTSDTEYSSIDIKSEPEDEDSLLGCRPNGVGEIHSVIGNAAFDEEGTLIKEEPS